MFRAQVHVLETAYFAGLGPDLAASRRELARRAAELDAAERALAAQRPAKKSSVELSDWRLDLLERIAQEHAQSQPERVAEWRCYLKVLREVTDGDGRLPRSLDWLIERRSDALPA